MKKFLAITLAAAAAAALAVTAFAASVTRDDAAALALKHLPDGTEHTWTSYDDGLYEVDLYNSTLGEYYEVKILPSTGAITEVETKVWDDRGGRTVTLTEAEAKAVLTGELPDAEILSARLDWDDGRQTYEISFAADGFYGEYDIHPETGAILKRDVKIGTHPSQVKAASATASSASRSASSSTASNGYIGYEKAMAIAQEQAPSARVVKCELDREDGRMIYEVEARDGWWEYDFEIDAVTGSILKSEVDFDD